MISVQDPEGRFVVRSSRSSSGAAVAVRLNRVPRRKSSEVVNVTWPCASSRVSPILDWGGGPASASWVIGWLVVVTVACMPVTASERNVDAPGGSPLAPAATAWVEADMVVTAEVAGKGSPVAQRIETVVA